MDPKMQTELADMIREASELAESAISLATEPTSDKDTARSIAMSLASIATLASVAGAVLLVAAQEGKG